MKSRTAESGSEDDWPAMVIVSEEDLIWDDELGYHRCPLGLIQTPRRIVFCREWDKEGGLKLYIQQLEREGICDVVVVGQDDHEVRIRVITCGYDHLRAKYPRIITEAHKWYSLPPLEGRALVDSETGEEVWVERFEDAIHAGEPGADDRPDDDADPDLDIPF